MSQSDSIVTVFETIHCGECVTEDVCLCVHVSYSCLTYWLLLFAFMSSFNVEQVNPLFTNGDARNIFFQSLCAEVQLIIVHSYTSS